VTRRLRWYLPLAALALAVLPLAALGRAPVVGALEGDIDVIGVVENGTAGAGIPAGLAVELHGFRDEQEVLVQEAPAAAGGSFRFAGVARDIEMLIVRVEYQGVAYYSQVGTPGVDAAALELPVVVYETTDDPSGLVVTQLHIFVTREGAELRLAEYHRFANRTDRTYVGIVDRPTGERTTVTFLLPAGATNLRFGGGEAGGRFLARVGGLADTQPILPGENTAEVLFSYDLPVAGPGPIERVYGAPVDSVNIIVPGESLRVVGEGLTAAGTEVTDWGPALVYTGGPLAAGAPLIFSVDALAGDATGASGGAAVGRARLWEWAIGLTALSGGVAMSAVLLAQRPKARKETGGEDGRVPDWARADIEALVDLDRRRDRGDLGATVHRTQRAAVMARIRERLADRGRVC